MLPKKIKISAPFPPHRLTSYWEWCKDDKNFTCEKRMSKEEFLKLHRDLLAAGLSWGIWIEEALVGGVIFVPQAWPGDASPTSLDIHISLSPSARGHQIMTKTVPILMEIGFKTWPSVLRYGATFIGEGTSLQKAAEAAGFSYEGRRKDAILWDGQAQDLILYGFTRRDYVLQRTNDHNHLD